MKCPLCTMRVGEILSSDEFAHWKDLPDRRICKFKEGDKCVIHYALRMNIAPSTLADTVKTDG
jgi:hypothetical protein